MKKVALQDVEDGMVLAEPLTGASGNILMGKGIAIKASIIPRLTAWGVTHVSIEGDPEPFEPHSGAEEQEASASLEMLFSDKVKTPPMDTIFQCLLRFRSHHEHR